MATHGMGQRSRASLLHRLRRMVAWSTVIVGSAFSGAVAAVEPTMLVAGTQIEQRVSGNAEARLLVDASAGPLVVVIDQLGVDFVVRCGNEAHERNSPSGPWAPEILVVTSGCLLTLRARSVGAPTMPFRARAFSPDSAEGRRWPRAVWAQWSQGHLDSGGQDVPAMSRALQHLQEVERVVAAQGDSEDLRFLRYGNANLLRRIGRHEQAVQAYEVLIRSLDPSRDPQWLTRASNAKGLSLRELDRFDAADQAFADAVRYGEGRSEGVEWVSAKNNRCLILHSLGKLAAARDCYAAVIPEYRELAPNQVAVPMLNLAAAADALGEPALALKNYRAVLELRRGGSDRTSLGIVLLNLANHEAQTGAWQDALEHSLEAQQLFEALGDKPRTVNTLNLRGAIYRELGEPARARDYLSQSMRIAQESGDSGALALAKSALARIETDDAKAAEAHREVVGQFMRTGQGGLASQEWLMLAGRLDALGDNAGRDAALAACATLLQSNGSRSSRATAAMLRGRVALRAGQLAEATALAEQAIAWRTQTRETEELATARLLKARAERGAGRNDAALAEIERALEELQRAERLPSSPVLAANLYDRRIELLDEAMDILLSADAVTDAALSRAWAIKWKYARAPDAPLPAPADASEHELLDELRAKVMLLSGTQTPGIARAKPPSAEVLADIAKRIEVIESQLDARRTQAAAPGLQTLALSGVQTALESDEVLISLNLGSRASGAWVTTSQSTRWAALPSRRELLPTVEDVLKRQDKASFDRLSELLSPLVAAAGEARRVMIIPDGPSHLIPYAVLRNDRGEFWIERSRIELLARAPVASADLRPVALAQGFPVVFWGARDRVDDVAARSDSGPVYRSGAEMVELPAVSTEFQAMKRVLGNRRIVAGDPRAPVAPTDGSRWMLHVAGHGLASGNHPYALAIALPNSDSAGFTYTSGQSLQFGARPPSIVFVNVCEGFSGRLFESQPPSSLARRFLQAGADVVVAASWPVEDSRAARFSEQFYAELDRAPADVAGALARAQREALRSGGARNMRYWAGYSVVHGVR